jgi:uncharacterized membrane protein
MTSAGFFFANLAWLVPVVALALLAGAAAIAAHRRAAATPGLRWGLGLRLCGITILALALLEPSWSTARARPGANNFLLLADDSRSLALPAGDGRSRADHLRAVLAGDRSWQKKLAALFQVRRYAFAARVERVSDFGGLAFDGRASHLRGALRALRERWQRSPVAGLLLFTDGTATDAEAWAEPLALTGLPPIYPVILGSGTEIPDVAVTEVSASDTLFEDAPVNIEARIEALGLAGKSARVELRDGDDHVVEARTVVARGDHATETITFRVKAATVAPTSTAPSRYRVVVSVPNVVEATAANNARHVLVPRPQGPARLLYVGGRPNWEYKFLRRALDGDRVLELAALVRIAPREPKFAFLTRKGEANNPLFRGFGASDDDAERFDEPVLQRLGTRNAEELRGGFPKTAEELFGFQGLIIDDLEASFFTAAQQALIDRFVAERGGGFIMLGGVGSFRRGGYARTPVGDLLPVHLDRLPEADKAGFLPARFSLSREGWLEAWTRLRDNEAAERARQAAMPAFKVANATRGLKPGATVLATLTAGKTEYPALVVQRAGEGRSAALTVGDLWRWTLHRAPAEPDDLGKFWRQTLRALVRDVPRPVTATLTPAAAEPDSLIARARVRSTDFQPADGAQVEMNAVAPDGSTAPLQVMPSASEPGVYEATVRVQTPGIYQVKVRARSSDGRPLGDAEAGRVLDLDADEHRSVRPNRALLERIAQSTGGAVVAIDQLDAFVDQLRDRPAPISDLDTRPLWHSPWVLLAAFVAFIAEWTLRRRRGLP